MRINNLLAIIAIALAIMPIAQATLTDGIKAYYSFDNSDATDDLRTFNGTLVNTPTFPTGKLGNGLDLERDSIQYVNLNTNWGTMLGSSTNLTVSYWVKPETLIGDTYYVGGRYTVAPNEQIGSSCSNSACTVVIVDRTGITSVSSPAYTLTNGVWSHILWTYDSVNGLKQYKDGTLIGTQTTTGAVFNDLRAIIAFGARGSFNDRLMDGMLDEIGIWGRALNSTEIAEIYNTGTGLNPTENFTLPFSNSAPNYTINSPINNQNVTSNFALINFTAIDIDDNNTDWVINAREYGLTDFATIYSINNVSNGNYVVYNYTGLDYDKIYELNIYGTDGVDSVNSTITTFRILPQNDENYCYQETTNNSNIKDGDCDLVYTGGYFDASTLPSDPIGLRYGTLYINYTKPTGATTRTKWVYKVNDSGVEKIFNQSIPYGCFIQNKIQLSLGKFHAINTNDGSSCFDGTDWITIADYGDSLAGGFGVTGTNEIFDGNWDTRLGVNDHFWYSGTNAQIGASANVYFEEAMWWDAPNVTSNTSNSAPTIDSTSPLQTVNVSKNTELVFVANISDVDNDSISYYWFVEGTPQAENTNTLNYNSSATVTLQNITIIASDGTENVSYQWDVYTYNTAPSIDTTNPSQNVQRQVGETQVFSITKSDIDQETLFVAWYVNDTEQIGETNDDFTYTALESQVGTTINITVYVTDGIEIDSHYWLLTTNEVSGYQSQYEANDITGMTIDTIGGIGVTWVQVAGLIAILVVFFFATRWYMNGKITK